MARRKDKRRKKKVTPFSAERTLSELQRLLDQQEFSSEEELNAFMENLRGKDLGEALAESGEKDPKRKAQDLAYDAMDAKTSQEALALARQALALDPDCVDALLLVSGYIAKSPDDLIAKVAKAVEAGERTLGKDFFEENKGHFWGILETRPYMRARQALADLLWDVGRGAEATRHLEAMLELNPNDNQGVRYELIGWYLCLGDREGVQRLLKRYAGDSSAFFMWGRVLAAFLWEDERAALRELKAAKKRNPYVVPYLTGKKRPPRELPEYYSPGQESEAMSFMDTQGEAWSKNPQAIEWVRANSEQS